MLFGGCLMQGNIMMPSVPKTIYSCNEGNYSLWDEAIRGAVSPARLSHAKY